MKRKTFAEDMFIFVASFVLLSVLSDSGCIGKKSSTSATEESRSGLEGRQLTVWAGTELMKPI